MGSQRLDMTEGLGARHRSGGDGSGTGGRNPVWWCRGEGVWAVAGTWRTPCLGLRGSWGWRCLVNEMKGSWGEGMDSTEAWR